ncbi:cytochrome P450 [Mycena olivaceomarginata]|nr:cytochrome P450 [Mycena olivaceomarginata]
MIQLLPQLASNNSTWTVAIFLILPLVGNLFDIPPERQWETYLQWSKQFNSDIIHLNAAGTAHLPMLMLMGWDFGIGFMKYGDRWRAHRRILHEAFNIAAVKQFQPQELAATHRLLRRILQDPRDIMDHFRHMSGALMMDVTYGIDVRSSDDQYISIAEEAMHGLSVASIPGAFLVDTIHALKYVPDWVPAAGFNLKAKAWRKVTRALQEVPFTETKRNIAMGAARTSFTSLNLRSLEELKGSDKATQEAVVKAAAANMYAAVVGAGQLPDFTDEAALPYVSAIVKEALRWKNVTPIDWWGISNGGMILGDNYHHFARFKLADLSREHTDLMDVAITRFAETLCEEDCNRTAVMAEYGITGASQAREELYRFKYTINVDGTTFSGRYLGLLRSGSLVFKIAWANTHPDEARLIQQRGMEVARCVLTDDQNDCYFFVVLLEWARLQDYARGRPSL